MRILGLRTVVHRVRDFDDALRWYAEAFDAEPYFNDGNYAGFDVAGYELGLMRDAEAARREPANVTAYWGVENVPAAVERLVALGAELREAPVNVGGDIVVASVADPWGNTVGLIFNPGFSAR